MCFGFEALTLNRSVCRKSDQNRSCCRDSGRRLARGGMRLTKKLHDETMRTSPDFGGNRRVCGILRQTPRHRREIQEKDEGTVN